MRRSEQVLGRVDAAPTGVDMLPEQRRREILTLLSATGGIDVPDLAHRLAVSPATVRRDLAALEAAGQLERTHGGAVPAQASTGFEPRYDVKRGQRTAQKRAIASHAAGLVSDGSVVVLDSGSTTFAIARELKRCRGLTVITVDLKVAIELAGVPDFSVIVVGGRVRPELYCTVGPMAEGALRELHGDIAFLGADAISRVAGVTNANIDEIAIKRALIASSHACHLVADASKFGQVSLAKVADLHQFDSIITDDDLDAKVAEQYTEAGAIVTLARA